MTNFRVLVTDYAWPTLEIEQAILAEVGAELVVAETGEAAELVALAGEADAILTCWKQLPPAALTAATHCRIISRYGIGLDNIPLNTATELGIVVTNVPDFCLDEVADHVLALILAFARRITVFNRETSQGQWALQSGQGMSRLRGQTLGVIGYGNIAQNLVPKAYALGLNIIVYTPRLATNAVAPYGQATNDLTELLAQADYVSLHVPLTAETEQMINAARLQQMKPTAILINTARGGVINEADLYRALAEGWIAGAGLDVMTQEPPVADHPLLKLANVIATPHAAFYSEAAIAELQTKAATQVAQALRGETPGNVVNKSVLAQTNCRLLK